MLSIPQYAGIVVMSMLDKDKAKEYADRIADINQQVQTGDVNFEQARVSIEIDKWLSLCAESTSGKGRVSVNIRATEKC
jgi:hypothetical protein